jgi:hypothetical protein
MSNVEPIRPGICGAKTRAGHPCTLPAGHGTDHVGHGNCKLHGGRTQNGRKNGAELALRAEGISLGISPDIEPQDLMLTAVRQAFGQVLVAQRFAEQNGDLITETGQRSIYWLMQSEAIDRAANVAKLALAAGIAERRVKLAERTAALIAGAFEAALSDLGVVLEDGQRAQLGRRVETHLLLLEQGEGEVVEGEAG